MLNKFDQKLIDFLTMICWWTEVRWEKNNLYWVYQIDIFEMILTIIFWHTVSQFSPFVSIIYLSYVFIAHSLIRLTILFFAKEFYLDGVLRRYPQGFPNFCRISSKHTTERYKAFFYNFSSVFILSLIWKLTDFFKDYPALLMYFLYFVMIVFSTVYYYFLACDSIPPEEKVKRKARVKEWRGQLQPIQISGN